MRKKPCQRDQRPLGTLQLEPYRSNSCFPNVPNGLNLNQSMTYIYILLYITWEAICSQKNMLMETQPQPQWERWTCWIGQPWKNMLHHSRVGRISIWELHHGQIAESDGCFCWFKGRLLLSDLNKRNTWAWVYTKSSIPTNSLAPSVQVERLIAEITHIHNHIFIEDPPMSDGGACWSAGLSCV